MRIFKLLAVSLLVLVFGQTAALAADTAPPGDRLDHILLWGRNIDQVTAVMAAKLGFQVRPGRAPDGVANRYIRMADSSFIELLGITQPDVAEAKMDPGSRADHLALHGEPGARSFGIHTSALEAAHALLKQRGFAVTPVFSAAANDPDGQGPGTPPRWQLFAFDSAPLTSPVFFIDYAPARKDATSVSDDKLAREHPNGARQLSAIWLLSNKVEADRKQLASMGFTQSTPVRLPQVAARGYAVAIGPTRLLLLEPDGGGMAAEAMKRSGTQVLGVSIGVSNLDQAQRRVERGYELFDQHLTRYKSMFGEAFLAPTLDDLGILVEFHAPGAAS
jgi:hypothetical protein